MSDGMNHGINQGMHHNPQQLKKIKSDRRKAEIMRLLAIQPMQLAGVRQAILAYEPDISPVVLRSTLYNMCCDGLLQKHARNPKNPTYSLASPKPIVQVENPRLRGFAKPRKISADRIENVAIMKATPLRKLPKVTASGSSLEYV